MVTHRRAGTEQERKIRSVVRCVQWKGIKHVRKHLRRQIDMETYVRRVCPQRSGGALGVGEK